MTTETRTPARRTAWQLWRRNALVWGALMLLLLLSLMLAYIPMGVLTPASGIVIAFAKATLVVMLFMELARSRAIDRLAAVAGLVFLTVMFALTMSDVLWRLATR